MSGVGLIDLHQCKSACPAIRSTFTPHQVSRHIRILNYVEPYATRTACQSH
jgi:hypothetical protein